MAVPFFGGFRYYISFIDDFTKFSWLYPLKQKSEAFGAFKSFQFMVQNQFGTTIKLFRTDNGREYVNNQFANFLQRLGILHQKTFPYTTEQNGVAECKHRHLIDIVITLLHTARLPVTFWVEALATTNILINRLPKKSLGHISPHEKLYNIAPNYSILRIFGCLAFPHLRHEVNHKLQPRSKPCVFVGYEPLTKGYRCFGPTTQRIYVTRHVKFHETAFPYHKSLSQQSPSPPSYFGVLPLFPTQTPAATRPATHLSPHQCRRPSHSINTRHPTLPLRQQRTDHTHTLHQSYPRRHSHFQHQPAHSRRRQPALQP